MTTSVSLTVCLVYEVSLATRRAHASSLIVAAAYVRFIRSTERMTTPYMNLSARPSQVGNSGSNGMDESPFLPAGSPIPPEAEAVVRDAVRPRTSCEGDASLPSEFLKQDDGPDSPIKTPRASHELKGGRPIEAVIGSSTHGTEDPTSRSWTSASSTSAA